MGIIRVRTHKSHYMTVAARAIAAMKFLIPVKACGDAAPVLEVAEHALNDVALFVNSLRSENQKKSAILIASSLETVNHAKPTV